MSRDLQSEQRALEHWIRSQSESQPGIKIDRLRSRVELLVDATGARGATALALVHGALSALSRLGPDPVVIEATILLPLALEEQRREALPDDCDPRVHELLEQLRTLTFFGRTYLPDDQTRAEGLRQLLMALVADVRVVLIALAWQVARLHLARNEDEATRREIARETQMIHAPLANRLGIWQLKWELEDLAFRYLEPETYQRISRLVAEKRSDRQAFIEQFMSRLRALLEDAGIHADVTGRAKHIYSIWRKMQRKGLDFHELFDVRAVRVLVDSVEQCYSVLGLVHTRWQPVPGEFDDYITNPKANLYQSLHTAVSTSSGRVVEVQIRTHEMHRHAELGVAAHWRYKEGGPRDDALEKRIGVMRQLLEGQDGEDDDEALLESFRNLTTEDRVYVLTPRGEVRDLAAGATPLDFAYLIHTEVGHRCRGARVNGRIVPLTYQLRNGDRVEILTAKEPRPSRDWLIPRLGYIHTARARAKVRQWFRQANQEENLAAGRQAVEAEFRRLDLGLDEIRRVMEKFNATRVDDLYVSVGAGDVTATQVAQAVERLHAREQKESEGIAVQRKPVDTAAGDDDVRIEGVGSLMHQMARCCQPVPGDPIAGYITRGRGVSIHRQDCRQFLNLQRRQPERVLDVQWASGSRSRYPSRIVVRAWDRRELIKDIGTLLAAERVNVTGMNAQHGDTGDEVTIELTVQVEDFDQLSTLLSRLQAIPSVTDARRLR
ncbi:RelA/SpoT family protein [Wenzhouxiangella sediminis]|uniref:GTP pyrophosphokinase n=1 Tax=Wenzhouxiangella sediminis TaxID=1792836 RepID=A0A3E1K576_9GAMM|nr:bifunctional (p)ppGpp synthetase/guanosine-3',5'-bis(diphosphate) 3'-pyrophosphohydrolase [Wenzhouxiangella sediminis]RFF29098.1 bifunctional (p)ppGpp synthetase/guanosine-3',5'-bis(diphosphate) 3'-pyrophosphohydrolase [Wenzhouxiangella sediminis]